MIKNYVLIFLIIVLPLLASSQCWLKIAPGGIHSLAIKTDGTLWAWGNNENGQLGNETTINSSTPIQIGTASNWKDISAGYKFTLAIKTDGSIWAWGNNVSGQIGIGSNENAILSPAQIGNATDWKMITAGLASSYAIKNDNTLWVWGDNNFGQLGDNTKTNRNIPVQIGTASDWKQVKGGGNHAIAIKTDGTLWAWGNNTYGQLGIGIFSLGTLSPAQTGTATNWKSLSAGSFFNLALKEDGTLWGWGNNNDGQIGDGTFVSKAIPTQAGTSNDWKLIHTGSDHSIAIKTDGTFWAWGNNAAGQLGDNTLINKNTPTQTVPGQDWFATNSGFGSTTMVIKNNNSLWAWGSNVYGQVGNGTFINYSTPVQIECPVITGLTDEPIENEITTYPNPAKDVLTITTNHKILKIEILNINGKFMKHTNNSNKIDISTLEQGYYLLKIYTAKKTLIRKFIKA
jgi:alpha-tubulin suppressor-like RCC1 family protein